MQSRLSVVKNAEAGYQAMLALEKSINDGDVPAVTLDLLRLRISQINGCAFCVDMHARDLRKNGESEERVWSVAAWHDTAYYTDAERAALALGEAATRIADNPAGVPDDVWDAAASHYDERQLAVLVQAIASINAWNRINVTVQLTIGQH